uniref:Uncharacterized protein n=1 Tax=Anoplophora glabripennis TaxID=217634 RepID=V5GQS7_ANOGL
MKPVVLFLTVLGCVVATPNGYYHQEYNYKTSASSYKNNELQHKTDDQGYYMRDGDLAGKVRPRVDANSEHSEYVNPNLRNNEYNTELIGGANRDLSSYGHMRANVDSYGSHDLSSEGLAQADRIVGTKSGAHSGYSSGSYGTNSYGSQSYATTSNLRSITSHIQQELERELQHAIQEQRAYSQSGVGVTELERELRQNLTNRLNTELSNRYGQQSVRGGLSYTIAGGRLQSTANYDNQELQDLRTQLESNLLNQLRSQYYQTSSHYETHQSGHNNYGYSTTVRPVYYQQPYRSATTVRPTNPVVYVPSSQIRHTPVSNPESITTIASRVQNQLDSRLNELLEDVQRRYFSSSSSYSLSTANVVLENLRNELRNNITYLLNENVKSNYGNQIPRDGHMYSLGPSGQRSTEYNYASKDLENLRSQIERNLIEKLNRDFETYKSRWYQQSSHSQSSQSSSNIKYGGYSTPRYDVYVTPQYNPYDSDVEHFSTRPSATHIVPLISSGGSSSSNRQHNLLAGSSQSGYEISSGSGGSSISELQRRLQQDLSRQLQAAISRGHYGSYSSSGSYNAPTYQSSLQELSNELNRNLTKQLHEYSASGYYSSYGNFDQAQLANLRNQLQTDLMRQLQQGLQQSFQASSSFSASSSSNSNANYRPTRGFDNYQLGQYRSGGNLLTMDGADCVGDDPNAYNNHRMKRSYPPYRSRPIGLSYSGNSGYTSNYGYTGSYGQQQELGQQVDESDLTQQVEDVSLEKLQQGSLTQQQVNLGQDDDSQLTQQVEDSGIGKLQLGSQNQQQVNLGQQTDDSDLTQQVEDDRFGKLQLGSQNQIGYGQRVDDSELTQQIETENLGHLQLGSQNQQQVGLGQQVDDSELTQQVEYQNLEQLQLGSQNQQQTGYGQQVDDSELTQQVENENFGQLQLSSQNQHQLGYGQQLPNSNSGKLQLGSQIQPGYTRQIDDSGLTQEVEDFGKLQLGSQNQQVDNLDLTQQVEDKNLGKLQLGAQNQQQIDQIQDLDLTQQVEDSNIDKLQVGPQLQQQVDLAQDEQSGLTQQVENLGLGKLKLGSQRQQQIQLDQQVDNSDLTQQVEDSHELQQREDISDSDLTQEVEEVNFGGERGVGNSDLIEPVGGSGNGKLQVNSQNQQQIQYGTTENHNFNHGDINVGQQEDNADLTQQQEDRFTGNIQSGSSLHPQQIEQINLGHHQVNENRLNGYNQNQRQAALELQKELSRQLKDAVRNYYTTSYSRLSNYQSTYQDLVRELERNLTKQLQAVGPSSGSTRYTYSFVFSGPQKDLLKQQLENELKLQLQREISIASGYPNLNQQQTYQELSNNELNQNIDSQSQTQQNINSDLTQQQQNGFDNVEALGGQTRSRDQQFGDLTQEIGYDQVNQQQSGFRQGQPFSNDRGRLQLGTQQIEQSLNNQNDLTQQVDTNHLGNLQATGQEQSGIQSPGQYHNPLLSTQFSSSGRLQFGRRPVYQKPIDNTNFINTEITQQQQLYPNQNLVNQQNNNNYKPNNLPTLNQVITQQDNEEANTDYPLAPASNLNQQEDTELIDNQQQKQENIDLSLQNQNSANHISEHILTGSEQDSVGQSTLGQGFALNKPPSYAQILRQGNRGYAGSGTLQTDQQTNSFNQNQDSFQVYLNNQQVELAYQLENELGKQLQDTISQNNYAISQSTLTSEIPEQILRELNRNITKQIEQIFNGDGYTSYSSYRHSVLTPEQKDKLQKKLLADLSIQLQQNLQTIHGKQINRQHSFHTGVIHSPSSGATFESGSGGLYNSYGSNVNKYDTQHTTSQLNYGQQEVVPDTEIVF